MQQPSSLLGTCVDAKPLDRELFFFMRTTLLKRLSGSFDRDFWAVDVVRAAQTYPSVWHSGLALTAMCKSLNDANTQAVASRYNLIYALEQYGQSVRLIMDILQKADISYADKEAVLLSSILLTGVSSLRQDTPTAMTKIGTALQIYYHWRFWDTTDLTPQSGIVNAHSLVRLFRRFESQFATSTVPRNWHASRVQETFTHVPTTPFASIVDAYSELLHIRLAISTKAVANTLVQFNPTPELRQRGHDMFNIWKIRFQNLLQTQNVQRSDKECILTLQILSASMEIQFNISSPQDVLAYDEWYPMFAKIVTLSERLYLIIGKNTDTTSLTFTSQTLSFSASVVESLGFVRHCRDATIRRKSICLLHKWPQQDGALFPRLIGCITEQVMLLEEAPALLQEADRPVTCHCVQRQYICAMHRVRYTVVRNKLGRIADLWLTRDVDDQAPALGAPLHGKLTLRW
ncbi:hypothetical protein NLG97_g3374 [Lecanicillium saksenae]|uniref:Uncharacterized protein n=1 Tax=Lecanicillium saksenae TaxID=468837 RepID=A0ACC1QY94_9HYPO|nr:hypothetical protein NLG97_g3374 [Lecanicillium saksenae]